jgi:hypothetical protein
MLLHMDRQRCDRSKIVSAMWLATLLTATSLLFAMTIIAVFA